MTVKLYRGDCLEVLAKLPAGSITAIVTDPPYGLKFMGKGWDHGVPGVPYWSAALRVLRPGGYMLAFGGTRTYHRLTCSIEDAGFEIRDSILTNTYEDVPAFLFWVQAQGFPKGKGCLKPAWEPIVLARKPGPKVLPLGIDECRVEMTRADAETMRAGVAAMVSSDRHAKKHEGWKRPWMDDKDEIARKSMEAVDAASDSGRWPPNLLLTHHPDCDGECHADCVVRTLGEQSGERHAYCSDPATAGAASNKEFVNTARNAYGLQRSEGESFTRGRMYSDTGTAARFYPQFRYCPKASRRDRNEGCEGNTHSTVKPTDLLEWLVRLACPEGGTVLDPFAGSGSTGKAAVRCGRNFIGIEQDPQWLPIARARIDAERRQKAAS